DGSGEAGAPTWSKLGLDGKCVNFVAVDPSAPSNIIAGSSEGFFRSKDGGGTWAPVSNQMPAGGSTALGVHPSKSYWLAVTGNNGMYKSTDVGDSWAKANYAVGGADTFAFDDADGLVFTVTSQNGVWMSSDSAVNWALTTNTGLPINQVGLSFIAFDGQKLYV